MRLCRVRNLILTGALIFVGASCGKDDDKKESTPLPGQPGGPPPTVVGELALTPGQVFTAADGAVESAGAGLVGLGGGASLHLDGEGPFKCHDDNSMPIDTKDSTKNTGWGNTMNENDPRYGVAQIYCHIAGKAKNSETISGSWVTPSALACAIGNMTDLEFDGVAVDTEITITEECFKDLLGEDTGNEIGDKIPVSVTLTAPSVVTGWDYSIQIELEGNADDPKQLFYLNFRTIADKFYGFSIYSRGTQSVGDDYMSFAANIETGELRYVSRRDITDCDDKTGDALKACWGTGDEEQWQGTQNLALLLKGTINAEGDFESLSEVHGAKLKAYSNETNKYSMRLHTLSGSLIDGASLRGYFTDGSKNLSDFLKAASHPEETNRQMCVKDQEDPVEGLCAGNDGIALDDEGTVFFIHPGDARHPRHLELWNAAAPLSFETISLSDTEL